jgi:hypothetical protein
MDEDVDDEFYIRADAHIHLSNQQVEKIGRGKVSASMMYATARFNAWISAKSHNTGEGMAESRAETIEYFLSSYRAMLEENLDEYIGNFDTYMKRNN